MNANIMKQRFRTANVGYQRLAEAHDAPQASLTVQRSRNDYAKQPTVKKTPYEHTTESFPIRGRSTS